MATQRDLWLVALNNKAEHHVMQNVRYPFKPPLVCLKDEHADVEKAITKSYTPLPILVIRGMFQHISARISKGFKKFHGIFRAYFRAYFKDISGHISEHDSEHVSGHIS